MISSRRSDVMMQSEHSILNAKPETVTHAVDYQRQVSSFAKFVFLTFEVFPLRLSAIDKVIKLIFSD